MSAIDDYDFAVTSVDAAAVPTVTESTYLRL
jgi:hypothetical protein